MLLAIIAFIMLVSRTNRPSQLSEPSTSQIMVPVVDDRLATTQHDLAEAKRVLNDAQSGLAERDREIAAANNELRTLRQELTECRAKASKIPTKTP
jgi:septal ring factor EnvC (AmiA/AmiB activator)